jgi:polyribonucleotide nucleotidyltransferase
LTHTKIETELAGRTLTLETGKWAKLADAAVLATLGGTSVLVTAQGAKAREGIDFFPLTVDYREKTYAAGKFPGGFFKREARPTNKEILTCRLIDRPLRPMFPDGFRDEVQVLCNVLVVDHDVDPDVVAMIGAFAAVWISSLPFEAPMGAIRVGYVNDKVTLMPSVQEVNSGASQLNLTMAASKDAITMVEAVFTRGETQAMVVTTLGTGRDAQIIDALEGERKEPFMLHYNFPPFCVGETGFMSARRSAARSATASWPSRHPGGDAQPDEFPLHDPRRLRDHRVERLELDGERSAAPASR